MKKKSAFIVLGLVLVCSGVYLLRKSGSISYLFAIIKGKKTVDQVLQRTEPIVDRKYKELFSSKGISYPPAEILLVAYKLEKSLELWARSSGDFKLIRSFPIQKASGKLGPKLAEGDSQVPEGIYQIIGLNPNSSFHLSLKLNYPNDFDLEKGRLDHRDRLGNDIFIHGKAASIGCLAMGDEIIEDLFTLVAKTGKENVSVIISPNRKVNKLPEVVYPNWAEELYTDIKRELYIKKINTGSDR
ncbi:L,D-transpeptidase family protein [Leptospira sarikeiensis]|uniref:L,D-transpeptidase family protein n=1 Tax=Leptospira sarikeiensis TaxID=2484943 RepID=UPI001AEF402D|nr:L,D-transpeptidase family protein [Leptospira sarikeiensis]